MNAKKTICHREHREKATIEKKCLFSFVNNPQKVDKHWPTLCSLRTLWLELRFLR